MSNLTCLRASLFCFLFACTSSSSQPPHAPPATPSSVQLRLASHVRPPYVDSDGNPRAALDLVSTALARAGYIAKNEIVPLDDVLAGLRNGTYDGSAALWRSEEREQLALYSEPYLENRLLIVGKQGTDVSAKSLRELAGKRVGIVKGYAYGGELEQAKGPIYVPGADSDENLRKLLRGELDYVLSDSLTIYQLTQAYPRQTREKFAVGTTALIDRTLHFVVRKTVPNAAQIIERFNQQLAKMLRDGSYHEALHVDWIQADVDGDGQLELVAASDKIGLEAPGRGYRPVGGEEGSTPSRFVVKGVAYDSWQAVPSEFKTASQAHSDDPGTARASVFQF